MSVHAISPATVRLTTADLGTGYRLVLWAIRRWVRKVRTQHVAEHEIRQGLACFGAGGAAPALNDFMMCVGTGATRPIEIRCDGAISISPDEYRVLRVVQAAAQGQAELCVSLLSDMVAPAATRIATQHCWKLAMDLVAGMGELDHLPVPRQGAGTPQETERDDSKVVPLFGKDKTSAA